MSKVSTNEKNTNEKFINFNMDEAQELGFHNRLLQKDNSEEVYLCLQDKIMWCKSKYPFSYDECTPIMFTESCCLVEASVYTESGENGKLIGKAIGSADSSQLIRFASPDSNKAMLYKLACGSALTRAYTKAGFGLQFRGDSFEAELEALKKERESNLNNATLNMDTMNAQNDEQSQEVAYVLNDAVDDNANVENHNEEESNSVVAADELSKESTKGKKTARAKKDVSKIISPVTHKDDIEEEEPAPEEASKSEDNILAASTISNTEKEETPDENIKTEAEISNAEVIEEDHSSSEKDMAEETLSDEPETDVSEANEVINTSELEENSGLQSSGADNVESEKILEIGLTHEMTLEEAKKVVIDFGKFMNGLTIEEIWQKEPRNIKYIYQHGNDLQKKAAMTIARNNEQIKQIFIVNGIPVV